MLPAHGSNATASNIASTFRRTIIFPECAAAAGVRALNSTSAQAEFISIFPLGNAAFTHGKDKQRPTGQIIMQIVPEYVQEFAVFLRAQLWRALWLLPGLRPTLEELDIPNPGADEDEERREKHAEWTVWLAGCAERERALTAVEAREQVHLDARGVACARRLLHRRLRAAKLLLHITTFESYKASIPSKHERTEEQNKRYEQLGRAVSNAKRMKAGDEGYEESARGKSTAKSNAKRPKAGDEGYEESARGKISAEMEARRLQRDLEGRARRGDEAVQLEDFVEEVENDATKIMPFIQGLLASGHGVNILTASEHRTKPEVIDGGGELYSITQLPSTGGLPAKNEASTGRR